MPFWSVIKIADPLPFAISFAGGLHDSIVGVEIEAALSRFLTGLPARFEPATGNPRLHAAIVEANDRTGLATAVERLSYSTDDLERLSDVRSIRSTV